MLPLKITSKKVGYFLEAPNRFSDRRFFYYFMYFSKLVDLVGLVFLCGYFEQFFNRPLEFELKYIRIIE